MQATAPGDRQPLLQLKGVSKRFGTVEALSDVSLSVMGGRILGLCGENGAGKSTLVKMLTGVYQPDSGELLVDGRLCVLGNPRSAQSRGIALVAQELSVCPELSVVDNIWLGTAGVPFFHKRGSLRSKARQALDTLGCAVGLDDITSALSLGQRQLVEMARMLVRNARIMIMDEPTATLSDVEIDKIFEALESLRRKGCAVVLVTHRLAEVFRICDSVAVMRNGALVAQCDAAEIDRDGLIALMLGRTLSQVYPSKRSEPGDAMLRAEGLTLKGIYGPLDLSLKRGAIVSLVGQLGAGSDEVVRTLAGLVPDTTGEVRMNGEPLTQGSVRRAIERHVQFISGDRAAEGIFTRLRVKENLTATRVRRYGRRGRLRRGALDSKAGDLARSVGIDARRLDSLAGELSGGNQQKVAFGRCLDTGEVGVLAMVEPTRGIDIGARADIYRLMRQLCDQGHALLVASSDLEEVLGISDIVITMYRGQVVRRYAIEDLDMQQLVRDITHPPTQP